MTLAMTTAGEAQGAITQINQRLQVAIGSLTGIVEEIRAAGPEVKQVDVNALTQFLTPIERADLEQLEHSYNELTVARNLVNKFRRRLYDLGLRRRAAGDVRPD